MSCVLKSTRIIDVMCVEICLCVLCVLKSSRIIGVMCVEVFQNYCVMCVEVYQNYLCHVC